MVSRPQGIASAILRGDPSQAYPHVRRMVVEGRGAFVAVSEREIRQAREWVQDLEGLDPCFSASAAVAGALKMAMRGELSPQDTLLVNLTGSDRHGPPPAAEVRWMRRAGAAWIPDSGAGAVPDGGSFPRRSRREAPARQ